MSTDLATSQDLRVPNERDLPNSDPEAICQLASFVLCLDGDIRTAMGQRDGIRFGPCLPCLEGYQ